MARLTPDQYVLPPEQPHISREDAWQVVLANKALVYKVLNDLIASITQDGPVYDFTYADILEETEGAAFEGALKAVERYDAETGNKFSSYAVPVIRNEVYRAVEYLFSQRGFSGRHDGGVDKFPPKFVPYETLTDDDLGPDMGFEDEIIDRVDYEAGRAAVQAKLVPILAKLTPRERDVIDRVAGGMTSAEVAHDLGLTTASVESALRDARRKARAE